MIHIKSSLPCLFLNEVFSDSDSEKHLFRLNTLYFLYIHKIVDCLGDPY